MFDVRKGRNIKNERWLSNFILTTDVSESTRGMLTRKGHVKEPQCKNMHIKECKKSVTEQTEHLNVVKGKIFNIAAGKTAVISKNGMRLCPPKTQVLDYPLKNIFNAVD